MEPGREEERSVLVRGGVDVAEASRTGEDESGCENEATESDWVFSCGCDGGGVGDGEEEAGG